MFQQEKKAEICVVDKAIVVTTTAGKSQSLWNLKNPTGCNQIKAAGIRNGCRLPAQRRAMYNGDKCAGEEWNYHYNGRWTNESITPTLPWILLLESDNTLPEKTATWTTTKWGIDYWSRSTSKPNPNPIHQIHTSISALSRFLSGDYQQF